MHVKVSQKRTGQKKDRFHLKPVLNDLKTTPFIELFRHIISCEVRVLQLHQQLL